MVNTKLILCVANELTISKFHDSEKERARILQKNLKMNKEGRITQNGESKKILRWLGDRSRDKEMNNERKEFSCELLEESVA